MRQSQSSVWPETSPIGPRNEGRSSSIGTAAAVLIDATVVRGILVPAALTLLGERAWRRRA